jgi:hypothetical protein
MTIARLSASPLYVQRVLRLEVEGTQVSFLPWRPDQRRCKPVRQSTAEVMLEWFVPVLTLLGTAAAMWFVLSDGWFQLFGLWALGQPGT